MRNIILFTIVVTSAASPVMSADQLKFGKAPAWVVPQAVPAPLAKPSEAPVAILLHDQQVVLEPGKTTAYVELAFKIQNPQGLAAGNISIPWNPATDTVTVHKLEIHRGNKVIDVLASGQTFTTIRREANLELAALDGFLTANIQPEDLQEGDIINLAASTEHVDPVMKNHVEATFGEWNGVPYGLAHARLEWPAGIALQVRRSAGLPTEKPIVREGKKILDISAEDVEPMLPPSGAPARFTLGRYAEATDFPSWAAAANLMIPLYRDASVIPPSGPLHDEVEKIRASSDDPKLRAEGALELVQNRVRYVALLMGQGSYVPASAETTWSRRFGDCKAKTALLLAILHALDVDADPVMVNAAAGDAIASRLPMIGLFNHVLVRANIGGKTYWLDGTRTGDRSLDQIDVPDFTWGLPLIADAKLVPIVPPPLSQPELETIAVIDASKGLHAMASTTVDQTFRGDSAMMMNNGVKSLSEGQRQEFFNQYWKAKYNFIAPGKTTLAFDETKKIYHLSMKGEGKLDWNDRYFHVPDSSLGYSPNFERPDGPLHDVPLAVKFPSYERHVTMISFPRGFFGARRLGTAPTIHETLAGIEYMRSTTNVSGAAADTVTIESSERSLVPEIPYKDGLSAVSRLRELDDQDVALPLPQSYHETAADLAALRTQEPTTLDQFITRGNALMNSGQFNESIADFTKALGLDPKNIYALADRALAYIWKDYPAAAEKDLAAARSLDSHNAVLLRADGLLAEKKGECETAVAAYGESLRTEPGNGFALGHRALCEMQIGMNDGALADSELALKANPAWENLRVLRANIFRTQGKKDLVAREAELLMNQNPPTVLAFVAAGKIYSNLDRKADSMKAFDAALAIKPEAYVYINRAQSRPFSDKAGRLADLDLALKIEPGNTDVLAEKAEQLAADGDLKGALAIYDRVVKVEPHSEFLTSRRAILLYKTGRKPEADAYFAAQRAKAKTSSDYNSMCWSHATADILLEAALLDCRHALQIKPDSAAAMDSLAFVLMRLGKIEESIAEYTLAIAKSPLSASYMGRSLAYAKKGDMTRADADRAEALRLDRDAETRFAEYGLKR